MKLLSLRRIFQRLVRIEHLNFNLALSKNCLHLHLRSVGMERGMLCTYLIEASSDILDGKRTQAQHLKLEGEEEGFWRRGTGHVQDGVVI